LSRVVAAVFIPAATVSTAAATFTIGTRTYSLVAELDETLSGDTTAAPPASQVTAGAVTSVNQI
jgi:hypothetical protein